MKSLAIQDGKDTAVIIRNQDDQEILWLCTIKPHGSKGHEWVLTGSEFTLTIGNWLEPKSRPSIMAEIRSETLWRLGPNESVDFLMHILVQAGASIETVKPSRVDLCLDVVWPQELWTVDLMPYRVTRACYAAPHYFHNALTGISIGKGKVAARLYDKPLEIRQKSKKFWMYDVWGIESVSDEFKVIRIESQFRREAIKQLGIESITDLLTHPENLWAYFSQKWLSFQDNPGEHHTLRKTFGWWKIIQNGFLGVQNATPLIRCKAVSTKKKQLFAQTYGTLSSMAAIEIVGKDMPLVSEISLTQCLSAFSAYAKEVGKNEFELNIDILNKIAKYIRATEKMVAVRKKRTSLGLPCNLPIEDFPGKKE
ncbi:MAG: hypothetical protein KKC76_08430 [Proteobacteria bacterium]|nr:hypothetical protein [Pseudomonadota bacterium]MBU4297491.1 hypothetical protein [Pseudomonadota bacterium]MCG2749262.1 hypothetical protein [Desulfobulbaceae bacterium]